jgi:cytochrome o ubiquinol oxidase subunit IV
MHQSAIDSSGAGRGNITSYTIGFIFSVLLTLVAFLMVTSAVLSRRVILTGIFIAAIAQISVHLHYFLHLNSASTARWNVLALLFTILIMVLFVGGSLWIMFNLNYRMM